LDKSAVLGLEGYTKGTKKELKRLAQKTRKRWIVAQSRYAPIGYGRWAFFKLSPYTGLFVVGQASRPPRNLPLEFKL
jgi:hypothetical protein